MPPRLPENVTPIASGFAKDAQYQGPSPLQLALEYTAARGLKPETLDAAGWRLIPDLESLFKELGNNRAVWVAKKHGYTAAFAFPANGDPTSSTRRARLLGNLDLFTPPPGPSFDAKYLDSVKALNALYQPPKAVLPANPEPHDLWIVEGAANALRLAQDGIHAVGIPGVDNWRLKDKHSPIIPDLPALAQSPDIARIILAFDSDSILNSHMQVSINQLSLALLKHRPDSQIYTYAPPNPDDNSKKWGPDDFLQIKGRAAFDAHFRDTLKRWDQNPYIKKCIEWQRYILIESTGKLFDTDKAVFTEVSPETANLTLGKDAQLLDPLAARVSIITFNHKHYLNSNYSLRAKYVDIYPHKEQVHFEDTTFTPPIWVVNNFRFDLLAEPKKGNVKWFYELLANVGSRTPEGQKKALKLFALKVQEPLHHLPLALGFIGPNGTGKSLLAKALGVCVGHFSDAPVNLEDTANDTWAGFLVREWSEKNKNMDSETFKQLIRSNQTVIRRLYTPPRTVDSRTLHITTNNKARQWVDLGDRAMIFLGEGKELPKERGKYYYDQIGTPRNPGPGIPALRFHLLCEVDTTGADTMDNWTEMKDEVGHNSQDAHEDAVQEIVERISEIEGLEILTSALAQSLLEQTSYKGNFITLRKNTLKVGGVGLEGVKIDDKKYRFAAFKNLDYWRLEQDPAKYREQYKMSLKLMRSKF